MKREAKAERKTKETTISVQWCIDGSGDHSISTGIPFFDHMLSLFAKHGLFDLTIKAKGDINVDHHHTVEDVGIVMGKALNKALASYEGIRRYGYAIIPMDESLCMCAIDLSGRPAFVWKGKAHGKTGEFDADVVREFFQGFVNEAKMSLHINLLYGGNLHHRVEAVFKSFGKALQEAVSKDKRIRGVPSTKGVL